MSQKQLCASIEPLVLRGRTEGKGAITMLPIDIAPSGNMHAALRIQVGDSAMCIHLIFTPEKDGDIHSVENPDGEIFMDDETVNAYQCLTIQGKRYHVYAAPFQR